MDDDRTSEAAESPPSAAATLFDLRTIIAVLFAVYGIALLLIGFLGTDDADRAKSGGLNLNIWTGAAMLVLAVLFVAWARLRPLRPLTSDEAAEAD
jgi:hypothetical protein